MLTCAEKLQYEGFLRREEMNAAIIRPAGEGIVIKQIVRRIGHSQKLIRQGIRGERTDIFRVRQSSLEVHLLMLDELWNAGCRNGTELWRRLTAKGFRGSLRVVGERSGGLDHRGQRGLIASSASGITRDHAAVCVATTKPWSNGQTEG